MANQIQYRIFRWALCLGVLTVAVADTWATALQGPLVQLLPSDISCASSILACNRLALDDADTTAELSSERKEIHIRNSKSYAANAVIADVLIHAKDRISSPSQPYLLHLVVSKHKDKLKTRLSRYGLARKTKPAQVEFEGWTVYLNDKPQPILTPELSTKLLLSPTISARVQDYFVRAKEITVKQHKLPAIELALRLGPLDFKVTRASWEPPASLRANRGADLAAAMRNEDWHIEFQSLSQLTPAELIKHDLFLFGVNKLPVIQQALQNGFKGNEVLTIGAKQGVGYVKLGDAQEPFAKASEAAYLFLRDTYIGMLLTHQWDIEVRN